MNYCIDKFYLKFNLYLLQYLLTVLTLFAFGKFLLLRHVIYEDVIQRHNGQATTHLNMKDSKVTT